MLFLPYYLNTSWLVLSLSIYFASNEAHAKFLTYLCHAFYIHVQVFFALMAGQRVQVEIDTNGVLVV